MTWGDQYRGWSVWGLLEPPTGLGWSRAGRVLFALGDLGGGGGFLSPALAWGGLELGEFCLLSVTWGGQYGGFLSPTLAWGGLELAGFYEGLLRPAPAWIKKRKERGGGGGGGGGSWRRGAMGYLAF